MVNLTVMLEREEITASSLQRYTLSASIPPPAPMIAWEMTRSPPEVPRLPLLGLSPLVGTSDQLLFAGLKLGQDSVQQLPLTQALQHWPPQPVVPAPQQ